MVGRLEHPNIVPIHDVGRTEDGRYGEVMVIDWGIAKHVRRRPALRSSEPAARSSAPSP